jgi:two-component system, NarL family, nitrate/nitrite response regulator NarL
LHRRSGILRATIEPPPELSRPTRVLAADSHPVYLEGLARLVRQRPEFQLVGEAGDAATVMAMLERLAPDVAVVDPAMPQLGAARLMALINRLGISTRVVLLAGIIRRSEGYDAIRRGATAWLSKYATREQIADAIRRAAQGTATIAPDLHTEVFEQIRVRHGTEIPPLSRRELEVLHYVADGRTAAEIAAELIVSPSTVRTHVRRACDKLGVNDRSAAVATCMRRGLLD